MKGTTVVKQILNSEKTDMKLYCYKSIEFRLYTVAKTVHSIIPACILKAAQL